MQSAVQPPIECLEQLSRARRGLSRGANGTDDETNSHRGFQPLAADVAQHHQCSTRTQRDDLEEIPANLLRRPIRTGEHKPRQSRNRLRDQHLLQFTRVLNLLLQTDLVLAFADGATNDPRK